MTQRKLVFSSQMLTELSYLKSACKVGSLVDPLVQESWVVEQIIYQLKVSGSMPGFFSPHAEVTLGEMLNPMLHPLERVWMLESS